MEKIIMTIERSSDLFCAYSENCDGIWAAGETMEACKADVEESIRLIKKNLPEERWPEQIKKEYELEYHFDAQSFLDYYSDYLSLAGISRLTGVNQKQLSNYIHHRAKPRRKQLDRISAGIHRFANELLSFTL